MNDRYWEKLCAEQVMSEYDSLTPELRAAVQEYGEIPWDTNMDVDAYISSQESQRQARQMFMFELAGV